MEERRRHGEQALLLGLLQKGSAADSASSCAIVTAPGAGIDTRNVSNGNSSSQFDLDAA